MKKTDLEKLKGSFYIYSNGEYVVLLGTKLYIECADGSFIYGHSIAADTGGAIKGNIIDLCYDTNAECFQFGRRNCTVYFLGDANWK